MGDLVVAEEGGVDNGPSTENVEDDRPHLEVTLHDRGVGAREGVAHRSPDPGPDVAAALLCGGPELDADVENDVHERAVDVVRVGEVPVVVLAHLAPLLR